MREHVQKMMDSLSHRGPECEGYWENTQGTALFGHRRLSIIDLSSNASQPMAFQSLQNADEPINRYSVIFNGAIYNYLELREQLKSHGYTFRTSSDTEVLIAAYDHYGDECVEHFDGMFSFGIWDAVENEFFAARDRFGEKPFFYSFDGKNLVFASEMKALWAAGIERKPDMRMFFNFLTIGYTDNPSKPEESFFENVFKLPAASRLFYDPQTQELEIEKYWELDPQIQQKRINDEQAIEKFDELFTASVTKRLRSDVSIGTSLSGGLDSSSVLAKISSLLSGKSINSFTAIFPGFENDEAMFASQVARRFGSKQHCVEITASDVVNDWENFIRHQEEPFSSASAFAQYKVFELAKRNGVTVLLDGQGADETLAGYSRYYKWYWQELFQKRKLIRSGEVKAAQKLGIDDDFGIKNVIAALFPDIASVLLERQYLVNALRHADLTREFVKLQSREAYYTAPANFNLNGVLHFNTCVHGLEELLRYADRNSMAHGRELRLPFLDHNLVEFVFSLPAKFKIREGWTKWILRKAMDGKLPDEITWRKKKVGFEPPQKEWMQNDKMQELIQDARRKLVNEKILRPTILDRPIVPHSAYAENSDEWKYLSAASYL
jgi:asparagine synthase (glutamine-hydrolysing)